ncbi:hypothetical protein diail_11888 [Diaporthe ilicicola]|nr:hypothetical protein diail_11888 [Diaporthe ilicicola]
MMVQNFLIGLGYYSILYYLPIFYQTARQMSVIQSALLILPIVLPQSLASIASGQYMSRTNRYGEVIVSTIPLLSRFPWAGFSLWVVATAVESNFSRNFPLAGIVVTLIIQGMGIGFTFQPSKCFALLFLRIHSQHLLTWSRTALVAAQAHSAKQDRAVVISSRNFLRALGGATGLAVASALYSNTLINHLDSTSAIPGYIVDEIRSSIFSLPDISGLTDDQKVLILDTYSKASRSVFYFWAGCIGFCLLLMIFIKDKGLQRKEETQENTVRGDRGLDEESGSTTVSGDDGVPAREEKRANNLTAAPRDDS